MKERRTYNYIAISFIPYTIGIIAGIASLFIDYRIVICSLVALIAMFLIFYFDRFLLNGKKYPFAIAISYLVGVAIMFVLFDNCGIKGVLPIISAIILPFGHVGFLYFVIELNEATK